MGWFAIRNAVRFKKKARCRYDRAFFFVWWMAHDLVRNDARSSCIGYLDRLRDDIDSASCFVACFAIIAIIDIAVIDGPDGTGSGRVFLCGRAAST